MEKYDFKKNINCNKLYMGKNIIHKLSRLGIVNRWTILCVDTLLAVLSSIIVLFFIDNIVAELSFAVEIRICAISAILSFVLLYLLGVHKNVIRHFSTHTITQIFIVSFSKVVCVLFVAYIREWNLPFNILILYSVLDELLTVLILVGFRVVLINVYEMIIAQMNSGRKNVLIYGVEANSVALRQSLKDNRQFKVVGFVNPDAQLKRYKITDLKVLHFENAENLEAYKCKRIIHGIIYPDKKLVRNETERLVTFSNKIGLKSYVVPAIDDVNDKNVNTSVKRIQIEDLLGRDEIEIDMNLILNEFSGKTVMVTGAAGSIGSELCRQLVALKVKKLILFDNAETPLHNIRLELENTYPGLDFVPFIGDVRSPERLTVAFEQYKPQVVFQAAAYKHVPLMEENPCEAVRVNVTGTRQVAEHCVKYGVEKMVMVSTDKAVNPTNVMGASKRLAEIYVQSMGLAIEKGEMKGNTKFITTRFGNVLGSNGSVIPYFKKQIAEGGPVTVTHPEITRYFMTIPEACRLVMDAAAMSSGSEIYVFDMGTPMKIADLAKRMIRLAGFEPDVDIKIKYTGLRPGEKLYEELLSTEENTVPTDHHKIRIAKVREYIYADLLDKFSTMDKLAVAVNVDDTVKLMKEIVPEFKSKNSVFEKFDK